MTDAEWAARAAALAEKVSEDPHGAEWVAAVAATPRHVLVPRAYEQRGDGRWVAVDTSELAYTATTLVTEIDDAGQPVSSSTKPDLMVRMLAALGVRDGNRVLEIGTGTGYNAALLAHRLGDDHVYSVDVDPELVETARERLAKIGRSPHLAAVDGINGWPKHAPYDRIIATCSVPRVPAAWIDQLVEGGKALVDVKVNTGAGNLVLLDRHEDRLQGRFTARWAGFMAMRHESDVRPGRSPKAEGGEQRATTAPAQPWNDHREVWLLACLNLPAGLRYGYTLDPATRQPTASSLQAPDGSWCQVSDGTVREAGPARLWAEVERAYERWRGWGCPTWQRFGLTVTRDAQRWWLDEPGTVIHQDQ